VQQCFDGYAGYEDASASQPLFAFGAGMAYDARFNFTAITCTATTATTGEDDDEDDDEDVAATCAVRVSNTGGRDGQALALVFVQDPVIPGLNRYWKRLAAFEHIQVGSGETVTANVDVLKGTLKFHDQEMVRRFYPGEYQFTVGETHMTDFALTALTLGT
jgi:hypothetical protein